MKTFYRCAGFLLLVPGLYMVINHSDRGFSWFAGGLAMSMSGAYILRRERGNQSLLVDKRVVHQMLSNARQRWPLGALAVILFLMCILYPMPGARESSSYSKEHPYLVLAGLALLCAAAFYAAAKYLYFVKYGANHKDPSRSTDRGSA